MLEKVADGMESAMRRTSLKIIPEPGITKVIQHNDKKYSKGLNLILNDYHKKNRLEFDEDSLFALVFGGKPKTLQ